MQVIKSIKVIFVAQYNPMKWITLFESNQKVIEPAGIADTMIPTIELLSSKRSFISGSQGTKLA
ncbi:Uncharacterised protein [Yersinia mollaretii]|nr:Uncharacterised protein [Yersinia mollaretii]